LGDIGHPSPAPEDERKHDQDDEGGFKDAREHAVHSTAAAAVSW